MKKSDVIAYFGTQKALRNALRAAGYTITQPAISHWGEIIPEISARRIADITGGALAFDDRVYKTESAA